MNYKESLLYIESLRVLGSKPGLSRVSELAESFDNPQNKIKSIYVTGTNGKGSVCVMLEGVLKEAGYKVGRFSSPWIEKINEYISIDGENISDEDFAKILTEVKANAEKMTDTPTEFETITVAAFLYFHKKKCDVMIIETGLGGTTDATNIIEKPVLSVITGVSLDHTGILGETVEEIAAHKSGIIRQNVPVIFGGDDEAAYKVISKIASQNKSEIYRTDPKSLDVLSSDIYGSTFNYRGLEVSITLAGEYQPQNASVVIDSADILSTEGFEISDENIVSGLKKVKWKGRFEILNEKPLFVFDGGHNVQGVAYTIKSIKNYCGEKKINILTGVMRDKDYKKMAKILFFVANEVFTVTPNNIRALPAEEYAKVFEKEGIKATAFESISDAVNTALKKTKKEDTILLAVGSLYMYKDIKKAVE